MPRRFFIHIGMHKTGSSSIQESFFNSRERLLSRGINYLSLAANHSGSMYTLFSEHAHAYRPNLRRGADTPEKAAIRREAIRGDLIRELEGNKSAKFIVSGEDLSRLRLAEVTRLRDTLLPHASGFTIIIYVREPYSFLSSAVQQRVQRGFSFDQIWREPHLPNYRARIEPYITAFGRENVDIRMFPPIDCGGDVVRDFVAAIGETDDLIPGEASERINVSLSHAATMILEQANRLHPIDPHERSVNRDLVPILKRIGGSKFVLPFDVGDPVRTKIAADVAWLNQLLGRTVFETVTAGGPPALFEEETLRSLAEVLGGEAKPPGKRVRGRLSQNKKTRAGGRRKIKAPRRRRLGEALAAWIGGSTTEPRKS